VLAKKILEELEELEGLKGLKVLETLMITKKTLKPHLNAKLRSSRTQGKTLDFDP
jgi:hypothetical protein